MDSTATELGRQLGPLRRSLLRATRDVAQLPDIADSHIEVMRALAAEPSMSPGRLATRLNLARSTVSKLIRAMVDAGLVVLTAFISPFRAERRMAREILEGGEFIEVFVDTPLAVAEQRDVKGLYAKARAGQLKNFTGIDSPYEAPEAPELRIDTTTMSPVEAAERIVEWLEGREVDYDI